ncbi:MAG: DUF599 domain-containing protein [Paracoccus sp. (in: a-proteobacteria)]|uniref:DUF599 domain-containing protein n=1 Tax=Paracoccus sp. TaxID=267 RepID=UPI0026DF703D|nr:DUF599 domain-containing protein [Paracoccus sp. (in: a-proteobacteria)]MDO5621991.1 DUF599 domain-containing protein [Paracoccus sp. (in: a-proteobacteria)]
MFTDLNLAATLGAADIFGLLMLFGGWLGIGWLTEHPPAGRPSVSVLMSAYRRAWMRQFISRNPRLFDANILTTLREGTAFFASACMIGIGGGLALIGKTEQLTALARDFDMGHVTSVMWEVKLLLAMFFVVNAFLKFVWSHRLFGYCAITMAAVPNDHDHPTALHRAMQAAELNITAARSFNTGLRSVYFSIAALAWLAGGFALAVASLLVTAISWRREFGSHSRQILLDNPPQD